MGFFKRLIHGPSDNYAAIQPNRDRGWQLLTYAPDWILTIVLFGITAYFTDHAGFQRQFSLTDTSIQHTFSKVERVPFKLAIVYAAAIPAAFVVVIGFGWRRSFWDVHNGLLGLLLSLATATVITNVIKITVGRPRPDFLDRCQPLANAMNLIPYGLSSVAVTCTVKSGGIINDGFKSFPSGHASFSFAGLGFLSLYLAGKMGLFDGRGWTIKTWIALVPMLGAALIAVTRTMDYRHHATDVLIGGLLGFIMALFSYTQYYPSLYSPACHLPYAPRLPSSSSSSKNNNNDDLPLSTHASGSTSGGGKDMTRFTSPTQEPLVPEGTVDRESQNIGANGNGGRLGRSVQDGNGHAFGGRNGGRGQREEEYEENNGRYYQAGSGNV